MSKVVTWVCDGACGVSVEQARRPAGWYTRGAEHYCAADRPAPLGVKLPRGWCPKCGRHGALAKNGELISHEDPAFKWPSCVWHGKPSDHLPDVPAPVVRQARLWVYHHYGADWSDWKRGPSLRGEVLRIWLADGEPRLPSQAGELERMRTGWCVDQALPGLRHEVASVLDAGWQGVERR